jgi:catechol 1,2-dioxygenase
MTESELTTAVLARLDATPDARLREIMQTLVQHIHEFAVQVRLTDAEWMAGIQFLTATGQKCDDVRQEFILLSDTLGVSSLVDMITHGAGDEATESTVLGPFYVPDAPWREFGASIVDGGPAGEPTTVSGQVRSSGGTPLASATLDVWQTAPNGLYDIQDPNQPKFNLRGRFHTNDDGHYQFRTVRPADYPVPDDGPVGELLAATGRHLWRAAHIHVIATAPGYAGVTTHIFDSASKYLASDAVFGVKDSLVREFVPDHDAPGASTAVEQDFVLRPLPVP